MKRMLVLLSCLAAPALALGQPAPVPAAPVPAAPVPAAPVPAAPATAAPAPAAAAAVPLQEFLERRVVEELAAEGTVLGRLGFAVRIQVAGNTVEISLLDITSQRVVRATKIDSLATDREAALATVTQVVANLVAQQSQVTAAPVEVAPAIAPNPAAPPSMMNREEAEARFNREAIGFGSFVIINNQGAILATDNRKWTAWQGELKTGLSHTQFYQLVNRPDLEKQRQSRRATGGLLIGASVAGYVASFLLFHYALSEVEVDDVGNSSGPSDLALYGSIGLLVASAGASLGGFAMMGTQPIDEGEAKRLAQKYNDDLRRKYGLPVVATARSLRPDFRLTGIAPYVGENQAGLAVRMSY